ncbi:MAG TPA: DUF4331 domain-containing protein [Acidobacteriota bacterium]|nr:DUF4331 domain-containing protein [Acidobacteriota bacterium]
MRKDRNPIFILAMLAASLCSATLLASSHMDAPLITLDDAANTTDVYAFRSSDGSTQYLTTALSVYPFEEPGIGPNKYNFDDNVLYELHVSLGDDVAAGRATLTYQFRFQTTFKNQGTILQSYLGVVQDVDDTAQNLTQRYTVTQVDHRTDMQRELGDCVVPPNNQGIATPFYNRADNGENPAKAGVGTSAELDRYTQQTICQLSDGHRAFAGQRDDGFYGDIQAVFDLLQLRGAQGPFDSQGGYNVHTIALDIPLSALGGGQQVAGAYATTSRRTLTILPLEGGAPVFDGDFVQVGRQGNPLFCEALVALQDKDLYNRTTPERDAELFQQYALNPELAALINAIVFAGNGPAPESGRTDIAAIFIPDLIKVDLSTGPARLAGPPDDEGFSRLSVFGGDALTSQVQPGLPGFPQGTIPGGWPNGRRFGDDVIDIAVTALISDLRTDPLTVRGPAGDSVDSNDISYNKVFPYAATPLNGRNHDHHDGALDTRLFFAQFGNGQMFSSEIVLSNLSTTAQVNGVAAFRDQAGNPLEVGIEDGGGSGQLLLQSAGPASQVEFMIPALGSLTIATSGQGSLAVGSAEVTADNPLAGVIRFRNPAAGVAGVQASSPLSRFTVPVRNRDGINTGLAVRNVEASPVSLNLTLLDAQGQQVASAMVEDLAAQGQLSRFITELFEGTDLDGFEGTLAVRVEGGSVAATALELGLQAGEFTTLPVSPLN